jgi:4-phytase/acid phosphatase
LGGGGTQHLLQHFRVGELMKAGAWGLVLAALFAASPALAEPVLERVVLLERHGVRSPTKTPDASTADQPWPVWPVGPGELTPHGFDGVVRMGEALKRQYHTLLSGPGCFVWGDAADQRTRESAKALAQGLAGHCMARNADGDSDPLFHAAETGICPVDADKAQAALAPRLDVLLNDHAADYEKSRVALRGVLGKDIGGGNRVKNGKIDGALSSASTLTEDLYLEYAQGMDAPGWGRAGTAARIAAIMPLHNLYTDLGRRTPYLAERGASLLAHQIAAALAGETASFQGAAPVPADAKFVALVGHDTNLSNLSSALGLNWTLKDQPDATAPATVMAFERWRDGGKISVRVVLYYQTLDQLRTGAHFDAGHRPRRMALPFAGCGNACTLDDVRARLGKIAPECIKP